MTSDYMIRQYLRSQELANRPEAVDDRAIRVDACNRARADREEKFPRITSENFEAADAYQNERIEYWKVNQ